MRHVYLDRNGDWQVRQPYRDPLVRAARTFLQAALALVVLQAGALMTDAEDGALDGSLWRRVLVTAIVAGGIAVVSWAHNELESVTGREIGPK